MVVWMQSDGNIYGQMLMNDGTKWSSQFQINNMINSTLLTINNMINSTLQNPSITSLKNNNYVVIWDDRYYINFQILTDN